MDLPSPRPLQEPGVAVRVALEIRHPSGTAVETVAVLNGGFEMEAPHLLLPAACAERLDAGFRKKAQPAQLSTAGGPGQFLVLSDAVRVRAKTPDRAGPEAEFKVLVSNVEDEALVSDAGIDTLGIRIECFSPPRWRFGDEETVRDGAAPQIW